MDDIFIWSINGEPLEEYSVTTPIVHGQTTNLFSTDIYHFFYWGIDNLGIYLEPSKYIDDLLQWGTLPDSGLMVTVEGETYQFRPGQGDTIETPIVLREGKLPSDEKLTLSFQLKVPNLNKSSLLANIYFNLVYSKRGAMG